MRVVLAVALSSIAAVSFAQAPEAQGAAPAAPQPEKRICKVDPEDTESRIRRRICKTASEWAGKSEKKGKTEAAGRGAD